MTIDNKARNQRIKKGANLRQSALYKVSANNSNDNLAVQDPAALEAQQTHTPTGGRAKPGKSTPVNRTDIVSDRTQAYNDAPPPYPAGGAGASVYTGVYTGVNTGVNTGADSGVELPLITMSATTAGMTYTTAENEAAQPLAEFLQSFSGDHPDCAYTQLAPVVDSRITEV